jgi:hypothetical protein
MGDGGGDSDTDGDFRYNLSYVVNASVAINKPVIGVAINYRVAGMFSKN